MKLSETLSTSWAFELDPVNAYAFWDKAFTKEECQLIIDIGNSYSVKPATVMNNSHSDIRKSEIMWLYPNEDTKWMFERLAFIVANLNERFFKFDIFGATEGFQFTRYCAPEGMYGRHIDSSYNTPVRKLSFTLQLSDPQDYEGGDLCLYHAKEPTVVDRTQGYVALFPSYTLHEVTPVTKGTRYSLVSWITGKPFK